MASKPGILTEWPWTWLGNFKYVVLGPFVAHSIHSFFLSNDESKRDFSYFIIFPFLLLRMLHNQIWISFSRYRTAKGDNRIVDKSIEFDQVDRERNWDDQIILNGLLVYYGYMKLEISHHLPLWRTDGIIMTALLHVGPVEFLYYWLHRALHHHFLYSRYHSHHHSSIATEPITCSLIWIIAVRARIIATELELKNQYVSINILRRSYCQWVIRVLVMGVVAVKQYKNDKNEGLLWSLTFVDEEGTKIQAIIFNQLIEKWKGQLEPNKTYYIINDIVNGVNPNYPSVRKRLEISFSNTTVVQECKNEFSKVCFSNNFTCFEEALQCIDGSLFDIVGILVKAKPSIGQVKKKRKEIVIMNQNVPASNVLLPKKMEHYTRPFPGKNLSKIATLVPSSSTSNQQISKCSLPVDAPLKAILFDIDGTLCDSDPIHYYAFREMLQEIGFNGGAPISEEFFRKNISGMHNDELCHVLFPDWDFQRAIKFMDDKEEMFRRIASEQLKPLNGLEDVCKWIEERGLRRAAVTNASKPNAELIISMLGLTDFFELLVIGSECERAKPFPDPYLKALQELGLSPEHAFVFEDSISGIKAGVAAGMPVVGLGLRNPEQLLSEAGAAFVIKDFKDLKLWTALEELETQIDADKKI